MLVGHEEKIQLFTNYVKRGTLSHAYLFFGDAGIGKHSFACALATFLEKGTFRATDDPLVDTAFIAPDEKGLISINTVRDLRRFLWQTPFCSPRRTAIIDSAEALSDEAQSALLKLVEEPSPHALLLFVTYDPSVLFAPLRSRMTRVYFPRLPRAEIARFLVERHAVGASRAREIAEQSFGRIGRALRILKGKQENDSSESDLEEETLEKIISLRHAGIERNIRALAWMTERLTQLKRFNLNPALQRKAIEIMVE